MTGYHIGIDSTDSAKLGMCTTYLGAVLMEKLEGLPLELASYPRLIRLNPNIPWKTRGNGAIGFEYKGADGQEREIISTCIETIEDLSVLEDPQTNPGFALVKGDVPPQLKSMYQECLFRIFDLDEAIKIADSIGAYTRTWKNGRGLIGALAAIGGDPEEFTYEAIMYRPGGIKNRKRMIDPTSIKRVSEEHPSTFFNIDEMGKTVCIPHSPCPVIAGIRGVDPKETRDALLSISAKNKERWVLWRTNQHTDAHIRPVETLREAKPFSSIRARVTVDSHPEYFKGGHLYFDVKDENRNVMKAWAYEPTKGFRKDLSGLRNGDRIEIWGSVREEDYDNEKGINLEKINILRPVEMVEEYNPKCPDCGGSTESMGKGQGLRCRACGKREGISRKKRVVPRKVGKGFVEPPEVAWRHLYRPTWLEPAVEIVTSKPFHGRFQEQ